jgi:hypothetical protein
MVGSIGGALAVPFAGIFHTATPTTGNVLIWADVVAMVVYAIAAGIVVKITQMAQSRRSGISA